MYTLVNGALALHLMVSKQVFIITIMGTDSVTKRVFKKCIGPTVRLMAAADIHERHWVAVEVTLDPISYCHFY